MRQLKIAVILGAALLTGGGASAATLFSPPLVAEGDLIFDCYLVNVGNEERKVVIKVFNRAGDVVTRIKTTLGPGEEDVGRADTKLLPRYCKFTVEGRKSEFRGSVLVRQPGVGAISALPAY